MTIRRELAVQGFSHGTPRKVVPQKSDVSVVGEAARSSSGPLSREREGRWARLSTESSYKGQGSLALPITCGAPSKRYASCWLGLRHSCRVCAWCRRCSRGILLSTIKSTHRGYPQHSITRTL